MQPRESNKKELQAFFVGMKNLNLCKVATSHMRILRTINGGAAAASIDDTENN